jgi:hypothetical protein
MVMLGSGACGTILGARPVSDGDDGGGGSHAEPSTDPDASPTAGGGNPDGGGDERAVAPVAPIIDSGPGTDGEAPVPVNDSGTSNDSGPSVDAEGGTDASIACGGGGASCVSADDCCSHDCTGALFCTAPAGSTCGDAGAHCVSADDCCSHDCTGNLTCGP